MTDFEPPIKANEAATGFVSLLVEVEAATRAVNREAARLNLAMAALAAAVELERLRTA